MGLVSKKKNQKAYLPHLLTCSTSFLYLVLRTQSTERLKEQNQKVACAGYLTRTQPPRNAGLFSPRDVKDTYLLSKASRLLLWQIKGKDGAHLPYSGILTLNAE